MLLPSEFQSSDYLLYPIGINEGCRYMSELRLRAFATATAAVTVKTEVLGNFAFIDGAAVTEGV